MSRLCILAFAVLFSTRAPVSAEEKPVEIPLKEIWAWRMPETRDLRELDKSKEYEAIIRPLLIHIQDNWDKDKTVAVPGEGMAALQNFFRLKVDGKKTEALSPDKPVSLVFYTNFTSSYIHLHRIEKQGNRIVIRYRVLPHTSRNLSQHLAFIPLGKLPPGKYSVIVEHLPLDKKHRDLGFPEPTEKQLKKVSGSFKFKVNERR